MSYPLRKFSQKNFLCRLKLIFILGYGSIQICTDSLFSILAAVRREIETNFNLTYIALKY